MKYKTIFLKKKLNKHENKYLGGGTAVLLTSTWVVLGSIPGVGLELLSCCKDKFPQQLQSLPMMIMCLEKMNYKSKKLL